MSLILTLFVTSLSAFEPTARAILKMHAAECTIEPYEQIHRFRDPLRRYVYSQKIHAVDVFEGVRHFSSSVYCYFPPMSIENRTESFTTVCWHCSSQERLDYVEAENKYLLKICGFTAVGITVFLLALYVGGRIVAARRKSAREVA